MKLQLGPRRLARTNYSSLLSTYIRSKPLLFYPLASLRQTHKKSIVKRDTDIVIEGLPRCANHFATYAFAYAQTSPVNIAHHFHAFAQLALAVKWGIPALALIRDPLDQISSSVVHHRPWMQIRTALRNYIMFMSNLETIRNDLVVADFPDVIRDYSSIIGRINSFYGTDFQLFDHSEASQAMVTQMIDDEYNNHMPTGIGTYPLPAPEKRKLSKGIKEQVTSSTHSFLYERAVSLYQTLSHSCWDERG